METWATAGRALEASSIKWILFDLGGVLVDLDFDQAVNRFVAESGASRDRVLGLLKQEFSGPPAAYSITEQAVIGDLDAEEYVERLGSGLGNTVSAQGVVQILNSILRGVNPDTLRVVKRLKESARRIACMSNTDDLHWRYFRENLGIVDLFEVRWYSFEQRLAKPHVEAFSRASEMLGASPGEVLFIDDKLANVQGARAHGMHAIQFASPQGLERALRESGII